MRYTSVVRTGLSLLLLSSGLVIAQPPGVTMEMINRELPLEGAPLAEPGPYATTSEAAFDSKRHILFRPSELNAFPAQDKLPVVVWGNGGCAIGNPKYAGFLGTIASHGFLVLTTVAIEGEAQRQQNADDLLGAIAWAEKENGRAGSPLQGKIDTSQVAVMGQSCGGFLSVSLGTDPRVDTIGVFNSGVSAPTAGAPAGPFPTTDALAKVHGPVLFINGGEVDFMMGPSHTNFELVTHVPAFYGARENAGHTATMYHPGGGEFANVASNWLRYQFKADAEAGKMFVGEDCTLCTNPNWVTESQGLK
ncbi:MAG: alpha/beta hydrolase [Pseudomonadota bacterium]